MTSTHASAQVAAAVSLSRDVIFEILSWLPAKSLGRWRCVSKEWRALISNRAFVATHRSRAEPLLVAMSGSEFSRTLLLLDTDGTIVRSFLGGVRWSTFWASLGDLACVSYGHGQSGTLVLDLATEKMLLSCFKSAEEMPYVCFGFGRAMRSGLLKVFRLGISPKRRVPTTRTWEVLTLGDGAKWRQTKSPPTMLSLRHSHTSGITVSGALHFLSEDKGGVLSFDLDNEKWKFIHGPQGVKEAITIAELNGALCMVQRLQLVINVWLLSDPDENIWIKAYTMPVIGSVLPLRLSFGGELLVVPLRVLRFTGELLFYYHDYCKRKSVLQVYDPRSRKCTEVKTSTKLGGRIGLCSSNLDSRFCGRS